MIGLFDQMNRFLMGRNSKDIYRSHHQTDIVRENLNLEVEFSWRWFGQLWDIWQNVVLGVTIFANPEVGSEVSWTN